MAARNASSAAIGRPAADVRQSLRPHSRAMSGVTSITRLFETIAGDRRSTHSSRRTPLRAVGQEHECRVSSSASVTTLMNTLVFVDVRQPSDHLRVRARARSTRTRRSYRAGNSQIERTRQARSRAPRGRGRSRAAASVAKNSARLPFRRLLRCHSSTDTTIGDRLRPCRVIVCGPWLAAACSISSLRLGFRVGDRPGRISVSPCHPRLCQYD